MFSKKKLILVFSLSLLSLTLAGCWTKNTITDETNNQTWSDTLQEKTSVLESIANIVLPDSLKCNYVDEDWQNTLVYISKDVAYFESLETGNKTTKWLSKDDKLYFWDGTSKQWFVIDLTKNKEDGIKISKQAVYSTKDVIDSIQWWNSDCEKADYPDWTMELPSDINFGTWLSM